MTILNNKTGNDLISSYIRDNKIFSVGRVGITEVTTSFYYDKKLPMPTAWMNMLVEIAGVYGNSFDEFHEEYIDSIRNSDINVFWNIPNLIEYQNHLYNKYSKNSIKIENRSVEPFYFDNPWSENLKGKTVLIIHPFTETINKQYINHKNIWENNKILPDFNIKTYKPVQSIGYVSPRHSSWIDSLNHMKNEINSIEFDIALLGCGAYGMPLCNFIKNKMNKSAIYIGGGLQILFGIKGSRWDNHEVSKFYNKNWVRPSPEETPSDYKIAESGSYW